MDIWGREYVKKANLVVIDRDATDIGIAVMNSGCIYYADYGVDCSDSQREYRTPEFRQIMKWLSIKPDLVVYSGHGWNFYHFSDSFLDPHEYDIIAKKFVIMYQYIIDEKIQQS